MESLRRRRQFVRHLHVPCNPEQEEIETLYKPPASLSGAAHALRMAMAKRERERERERESALKAMTRLFPKIPFDSSLALPPLLHGESTCVPCHAPCSQLCAAQLQRGLSLTLLIYSTWMTLTPILLHMQELLWRFA